MLTAQEIDTGIMPATEPEMITCKRGCPASKEIMSMSWSSTFFTSVMRAKSLATEMDQTDSKTEERTGSRTETVTAGVQTMDTMVESEVQDVSVAETDAGSVTVTETGSTLPSHGWLRPSVHGHLQVSGV